MGHARLWWEVLEAVCDAENKEKGNGEMCGEKISKVKLHGKLIGGKMSDIDIVKLIFLVLREKTVKHQTCMNCIPDSRNKKYLGKQKGHPSAMKESFTTEAPLSVK